MAFDWVHWCRGSGFPVSTQFDGQSNIFCHLGEQKWGRSQHPRYFSTKTLRNWDLSYLKSVCLQNFPADPQVTCIRITWAARSQWPFAGSTQALLSQEGIQEDEFIMSSQLTLLHTDVWEPLFLCCSWMVSELSLPVCRVSALTTPVDFWAVFPGRWLSASLLALSLSVPGCGTGVSTPYCYAHCYWRAGLWS